MEALAGPSGLSGLDEADPKSMARGINRLNREVGEELGDGIENTIDRALVTDYRTDTD